MPNPWSDLSQPWYAALVADDRRTYGIARRIPGPGGQVAYEVLDRVTGTWHPTTEGPGYFSGAGGVTDAVPVTADEVDDLVLDLTRAAAGATRDLRRFVTWPGEVSPRRGSAPRAPGVPPAHPGRSR